jgi:maltooligosyltrehalose trehalohydrolase
VDGLSAHHFIGFIQNHDQVGNRAKGERIEHLVGMARAKMAAGLLLTAPFLPMLWQGEEYAASTPFLYFADHEDEEMAKMVSEGRKKEFAAFGFGEDEVADPEDVETFDRSKLDWSECETGKHAEMRAWFKKLIWLRRHSQSLNDGDKGHVEVRWDEKKKWLMMDRGLMRVICNLGEDAAVFEVPEGYELAACSVDGIGVSEGMVTMPPDGFAVLSGEREN